MNEKRVKKSHKFINTISDPHISPFIDMDKFCRSEDYRIAVEVAVDHVAKHGNFTLLNNLYSLLHGTPHANNLILLLRPKLNFVVTDNVPPKLKKASSLEVLKAADRPVASKKPVKLATPMPVKRLGLEKEKRSEDLLDSRLMLPGSFGTGKKR